MAKWEYLIIEVEDSMSSSRDKQKFMEKLNEAGRQGWRIVPNKDVGHTYRWSCLMEREVPEPPSSTTEVRQPPERKSVWKILKNQKLSAAAIEVILENFQRMGVTFPDEPPATPPKTTLAETVFGDAEIIRRGSGDP